MHNKNNALELASSLTDKAADYLFKLAIACFGFLAIPMTIDVVLRMFFDTALEGVIELEEFVFAVGCFASMAFIQKQRDHIRVDLFVNMLSKRTQNLLQLHHMLVGGYVYALIAVYVFKQGLHVMDTNEYSYVFIIPFWPFYFFAALCCLLLVLILIKNAMRSLSTCIRQQSFAGILLVLALVTLSFTAPWLIKGSALAADKLLLGGLAAGYLMVLLFAGMPIGYCMAFIGISGLLVIQPKPAAALSLLGIGTYATASNFTYTVIPLFMLMGELAYRSGISKDLFRTASAWTGRLPGGLAVAAVAGCAGFAAVCGESLATALTMTSTALPEMREKKYDVPFACATIGAGGTLGILIPPSTGFIFYAIITEVSIGKLFMAGILPGILLAGLFIGVVLFTAWRNPAKVPAGNSVPWGEKLRSLRGTVSMLILIVLILGGILSGSFSPNEGGAIGAVGALLIAMAKRSMTWRDLVEAIASTTLMTAKLIFILLGVTLLGYFLAGTRLPFIMADAITGMNANKYVILAVIIVFYIIMGAIMNVIPMMLLTLPAIYPTVLGLGFDPIWFGVVVVVLMEMGLITPPIGMNVFGICGMVKDVSMSAIFKEILPFCLIMCVCILLLVIFPGIALWLPSTFF